MSIVDTVAKSITPKIEELGFEVVDIEYEKKYGQMNLTVYIDIPRGVNLDDCETVNNAVNPILDELDPTNGAPYILNVSSPGLDRPFKKQRDFERNYGKEVEVKLYAPLKGKKLYEGVLQTRDNNTVTILCGGEELKIENSRIAFVRPLVKFE